MASLFISHSSKDDAIASQLRTTLKDRGYASLFLDFDPEDGIPAGRDWEHELYLNLRRRDAVIFLLSKASADSRWCFAELALARSIQKPVFGLIIEAGATLPLLEDRQLINCPKIDDPTALNRLYNGLLRAGLKARDAFSLAPDRPPYPGLQPFDSADAAVFFGRDSEIDRLLGILQPTLSQGGRRSITVVGGSGSGKSSLIRAGLIPRLSKPPGQWYITNPLLPGARPLASLARTLSTALRDAGIDVNWRDLEEEIRKAPDALVDRGHDLVLGLAERPSALLMLVDQLEEVVTRASSPDAGIFLRLLRAMVKHEDTPWWVIATLRADFVTARAGDMFLSDLPDQVMLLSPLSQERFFEVIEKPAVRAGLEFETGVVGRMVQDTLVGDALPLLAYTLRRLYDRAREEDRLIITAADYEQVGGVTGSLKLQATRVLEELSQEHSRAEVIASLLRFAAVDDEDRLVGQALRRSRLDPKTRSILDAFVAARLVKSDGGEQETSLEVAHEALLRQWEPLREAVEAVRQELQLRRRIRRAAGEWDRTGRQDPSYLVHRGSQLSEAESLLAREGFLGALEHEYVHACLSQRDRERSERERRDRELADALALRIWEGARSTREQSPLLASHFLANAAEVARNPILRASVLRDQAVYLAGPELIAMFDGGLSEARFSPSSDFLACCEGSLIRLRAAQDGSELGVDFKLPARASGLCFSDDGCRLLGWTGSGKPLARLWDPVTGKQVGKDLKHYSQFDNAVFSRAGGRLFTIDFDTLHIWSAEDGKKELELKCAGKIQQAAFSADGTRVLMVSLGKIRLVSLPSGADVFPPLEANGQFEGAVLSEDGSRMLSWTNGMPYGDGLPFGTVKLWDTITGQELQAVEHTTYRSQGAFFCDAGQHFATYLDGWLTLWAADGRKIARIDHDANQLAGGIVDALPTRDGFYLLTIGAGMARFFGSTTGTPVGDRMLHPGCRRGAFDHHEERFASWSLRTVMLWLPSGLRLGPEMLHESNIETVIFSPRGGRLLTRTSEGTTRLWKVPMPTALSRILVHDRQGGTDGAMFSPDGRYVLGWAWAATLWNADSGERIGAPMNYLGVAGRGVWGGIFSEFCDRLVTAGDAARVWAVETAEPIGPILKHPGGAAGAVFVGSQEGIDEPVITWGGRSIRKWQPLTGEELCDPLTAENALGPWALSPETRTLAAAEGLRVHLWDLDAWRLTGAVIKFKEAAAGLRFNTAGDRLMVWPKLHRMFLYEAGTGKVIARLKHDGGWKHPPSFGGQGTTLVAWSGKTVEVRSADNGAEIRAPVTIPDYIVGASLDGPGGRLAVWGIDLLRVFDVQTGEQLGPTLDHQGVRGARFTRDGSYVLSWGTDGHARLWSPVSGHQVGPEMAHGGSLKEGAFSPSEDRILTIELAGFPHIWELGDFHFPAEHQALRVRVQSGTFFDAPNAKVRPLDREAWVKERDAYRALEKRPRGDDLQ
jgi:WD40 repeat protein